MKAELVKCKCPCRSDKDFKHVQPCCENGWIEIPVLPSLKTAEQILSKHLSHDVIMRYGVAIYEAMEEYADELKKSIKKWEDLNDANP